MINFLFFFIMQDVTNSSGIIEIHIDWKGAVEKFE